MCPERPKDLLSRLREALRSGHAVRQKLTFLCGLALLAALFVARAAGAHPQLEDRIDVAKSGRDITVVVRCTVQTVVASLGRAPARGPFFERAELDRAARDHVPYLLAHLAVDVDGVRVLPSLASVFVQHEATTPVHRLTDLESVFATFELRIANVPHARAIKLGHTMLEDVVDPGGRWTLTYVVTAHDSKGKSSSHVLTSGRDLVLSLDDAGDGGTFRSFFVLGATHALTGLDHLLFLAALALGARRLRDLAIVVLAFTVAHTATLTLAALAIVSVSSRVVEPLVGLSIILAAHAARPQGNGGQRWAPVIAFGFGLVHGLAFAGGLRDALAGDRSALALALVAFALGLELAQQALVAPVFAGAVRARRFERGPIWLDRARLVVMALGILFFVQALKRGS